MRCTIFTAISHSYTNGLNSRGKKTSVASPCIVFIPTFRFLVSQNKNNQFNQSHQWSNTTFTFFFHSLPLRFEFFAQRKKEAREREKWVEKEFQFAALVNNLIHWNRIFSIATVYTQHIFLSLWKQMKLVAFIKLYFHLSSIESFAMSFQWSSQFIVCDRIWWKQSVLTNTYFHSHTF